MHVQFRTALLTAVSLCASIAAPAAMARSAESAREPAQLVEAVWKVQSFNFVFGGYTTTYSCNTLARRVRNVLMSVGVPDSITISMLDCADLNGGARMQITLASPVEATPENVRALTSHDSRDELIAKLRNEPLETAADLKRFAASWTEVSLSKAVKPRLEPGDCELVRQIRRDVLPRLSVRVLREDLNCTNGGFVRFTPPRLTVSALLPVPVEARSAMTSAQVVAAVLPARE
jgi:hypothetical protein